MPMNDGVVILRIRTVHWLANSRETLRPRTGGPHTPKQSAPRSEIASVYMPISAR